MSNKCFTIGCKKETNTEFCHECLTGSVQPHVNEQLENNFKYHSPKDGQTERYQLIREKAKELAYLIDGNCPPSREKSIAMTELETAVMWANASIARNE